jgi:hypothetical protein
MQAEILQLELKLDAVIAAGRLHGNADEKRYDQDAGKLFSPGESAHPHHLKLIVDLRKKLNEYSQSYR